MDSAFMPDPQSRASTNLLERVKQLEERLDKPVNSDKASE
jgi:hypothetical protein